MNTNSIGNITSTSEIKAVSPNSQHLYINKQMPNDTFVSTQQTERKQEKTGFWDKVKQHFEVKPENIDIDKDTPYDDEDIMGIDPSTEDDRAYLRNKILMRSGLLDEELQVKSLDDKNVSANRLPDSSKYAKLGIPRINRRTGLQSYVCENLKEAPDDNGVRGKTPLAGKEKRLGWCFDKLKEAGIRTVIDLRSKGECSNKAMELLSEKGLNYVNFPVEDMEWTNDSLKNITSYINAVNDGDFYVGCANGESRTDLAVAINYLLNPKAKNMPIFYFSSAGSTRVSVRENMAQIYGLIKQNPETVKDWGWNSYEQFADSYSQRLNKLLENISVK